MADLKAVFIIMLMINIGVMLIFSTGLIDDTGGLFDKSRDNLGAFFVTTATDFNASGNPTATSLVNSSSGWAQPQTEDVGASSIIFRSDNPLRMIADGLGLILKFMFGLIYVLVAVNSPLFVIWLIGIPFTMIYVISGIMFIRGVN